MALITLTHNPQLITVSGTSEHEIDFDGLLEDRHGSAWFELVSGSSVQINASGIAITSETGAIKTAQPKMILPAKKGRRIKYKGGAGSETYHVGILND